MMNKKGFTLVEVLVSITLVTIVLVFMINTLVKLKSIYNESDKDTDIIVSGALISRTINNDVTNHEGIRIVKCNKIDKNNYVCDIELIDGNSRKLELRNSEVKSNVKDDNYTIEVSSTIEYSDTKSDYTIFIKTINSKNYYNTDKLISSDYYYFNAISYEKYDSGISTITIKATNKKYDVKIYSN